MAEMTMEEIEEQLAAAEAPKPVNLSETKLDGDEVPEEFRGKTLADVLKGVGTMKDALRISESARQAAEAAREASSAARSTPAPVVQEEPEMTREQLKELYDNDPLAAIEKMQEISMKNAERHLASRLAPLEGGVTQAAENWARQEFATEFELFGKEISDFVAQMPNKAVFSTKKGWEDMVAYIRGRQGNLEKYIDHKQNGRGKSPSDARSEQINDAGFQGSGDTPRISIPKSAAGLDETQKKIAQRMIDDGLIKNMDEYVRFM